MATLAVAAAAAYLLAKRAHRAWQDRLATADLLVSLRDDETSDPLSERCPARRRLPEALVSELAKAFAQLFSEHAMYRFLYRGSSKWRRAILADLFHVHAIVATSRGRARFFVDARDRRGNSRLPLATCFACVYAVKSPQPGVMDIVNAGGLSTFARLGAGAFSRSYQFEEWLVTLRAAVAPSSDYYCVDNMFVRDSHQCKGVGSAMLTRIVEEATLLRLPVLVVVTERDSVDFFARHGFGVLRSELYAPDASAEVRERWASSGVFDPPMGSSGADGFIVWLMWRAC